MLSSVFRIHRVIAGGFGMSLLLAPEAVNKAMAPSRTMPTEERLTLQSWAAFMLAVAGIAHAAPTFPPDAQRSVAKALLGCFVVESLLYTKALLVDLRDHPADFRIGFGATGGIFIGLAVAYAAALAQPLAKRT